MAQPLTMESLMELLGARAMGAAVSTAGEVAAPLFASPLLAPAPTLAGDAESQLALALASALAAPTAGAAPWAHAMAAPSLPPPDTLARRLAERLATRLCEQPQQPLPYLPPAAAPLPLPRLDLSQVPSAASTGTAARFSPGEWGPSHSDGSPDASASRVRIERVATAQWAPPEVVSHLQARHMAAAAIFEPPRAGPASSPHCDAPAGGAAGAAVTAPPAAGVGMPPSPPLAAPPPAAAPSAAVSGAAW
ncbi:hypothetical protein Rsub_03801 [Raphidocelis subcapitata]|uniref:Uncharacterized protein n=1 Tax=Raphidocelis subcapitata TaxID=307507 RepID=A0A2V0NTJ0_9CHLO|nr:hypothetical protein Rsub_03801 [Raphidocelis subcapitata]|eukprot:GBF90946.1 hypothetical protein Rsub_03801 [Raphidocelis subcapitata]